MYISHARFAATDEFRATPGLFSPRVGPTRESHGTGGGGGQRRGLERRIKLIIHPGERRTVASGALLTRSTDELVSEMLNPDARPITDRSCRTGVAISRYDRADSAICPLTTV